MDGYPARAESGGTTVRFVVSADALAMVSALGGHLHATVGGEGCRARSLVFSTDEPRERARVECTIDVPPEADEIDWDDGEWTEQRLAALAERIPLADCRLTVGHELFALLDGAELDFGEHLGMQRFVWARLAGDVERAGRRCTCLRTLGEPRGKRATCLDDAGQGLVRLA